MALIDEVKQLCDRLAPAGWRDLFLLQNIDISQQTAASLESQLSQVVSVDRTISGFEDFELGQSRGVEPGAPSASLLYHAFASPGVTFVPQNPPGMGLGRQITEFPTLEELDLLENYIFARANRTLDDVRQVVSQRLGVQVSDVELVTAVFACEYRPASETPHQRHADLCLSRTGVARVGTAAAHYEGAFRGFSTFVDGDPENSIRVLPCRYVTYLGARSTPRPDRFGPSTTLPPRSVSDVSGDDVGKNFVVPVHKLFAGTECLQGMNLTISLSAEHRNQKVARLHQRLDDTGNTTGFSVAQRDEHPFTLKANLATFSSGFHGGTELISPVAHRLCDPGEFEGEPLSFPAPPMSSNGFSDGFVPSLTLQEPPVPVRPWPEYAHVRQQVNANGSQDYLGDDPDVLTKTRAGNYRALNFIDHTADGWVRANVAELSNLETLDAYSILAAPDFFPGVDQREVFQWWSALRDPSVQASLEPWMRDLVQSDEWQTFWERQPIPLSNFRSSANVNLDGGTFSVSDNTVTAVVTTLKEIDLNSSVVTTSATQRHATLPDAAAGFFAPGWDTSADRFAGELHLSAYGLGSPFPEDAKLCAALSTFWPAVAPDSARTFRSIGRQKGTVCPMTDDELGSTASGISWDGITGPRVVFEDETITVARYPLFDFADYTINAVNGMFSIALTSQITLADYTSRIIAMRRTYRAMAVLADRFDLDELGGRTFTHVLSYSKPSTSDPIIQEAFAALNPTILNGPLHRFDMFSERLGNQQSVQIAPVAGDVTSEDVSIPIMFTFLVGSGQFVFFKIRQGDGSLASSPWDRIDV